jgi:hypothetical protein
MADSPMTVLEGLSKYELDLMGALASQMGWRWCQTNRRICISLWKGE